jgi:N utilization substance protein B
LSRRKAREYALKVLFQVDQVNSDPQAAFNYLLREGPLNEKDQEFCWALIESCLHNLPQLDQQILQFSRDCSLERIPSIDRNIMRVALSEMLLLKKTTPVVAIDEAIEIAKKYSDEGSAKFINAILDKVLVKIDEAIPGD